MLNNLISPVFRNVDWLQGRTIYYVLSGSRAYGLNRPDSDYDFRGVCIPPQEYRNGFLKFFNQAECREPDSTIYDIRKFFSLAADSNPNICEMLWVEDEDIIISNEFGKQLRDIRSQFLSRKVLYTFRGYAISQLKRLKTHRKWLLDPPMTKPTRQDFGLKEYRETSKEQMDIYFSLIKSKIDSWEIDFGDSPESLKIMIQEQIYKYLTDLQIGSNEKFLIAGNLVGIDENVMKVLLKEKEYQDALSNYQKYNNWKETRNPKRAELEKKFGFDSKFAVHLYRLMTMCQEILETGKVIVRRPDAKELLDVLNGKLTYDELIDWADNKDRELASIAGKSILPNKPDRITLDQICQNMIERFENGK